MTGKAVSVILYVTNKTILLHRISIANYPTQMEADDNIP